MGHVQASQTLRSPSQNYTVEIVKGSAELGDT